MSRDRHPVERALAVLGGRAYPADCDGGFVLDGRPATAKQVVEAANAELEDGREPPILYPGVKVRRLT